MISVMLYVAYTSAQHPSECKDFCTFEYNPVCAGGADGKTETFGNLCAFEAHQCKNKLRGKYLLFVIWKCVFKLFVYL